MQQSGICSQPHLTSVRSFNLQLFLNILLRYHNCVHYQVVCIQHNYILFRLAYQTTERLIVVSCISITALSNHFLFYFGQTDNTVQLPVVFLFYILTACTDGHFRRTKLVALLFLKCHLSVPF